MAASTPRTLDGRLQTAAHELAGSSAAAVPGGSVLSVDERLKALAASTTAASDSIASPAPSARGPVAPLAAGLPDAHAREHKHATGHSHDSAKSKTLVDVEKIGAKLHAGCGCRDHCLSCWSVQTALPFREHTAKQDEKERLLALLDYVEHCHKSKRGYNEYIITSRGVQFSVCRQAFIAIISTSSYKLTRAIKLFHKHLAVPEHGNVGKHHSSVEQAIEGWLIEFRDSDCEKHGDHKWLLPGSSTWREHYACYVRESAMLGLPVGSYELFCTVRKAKFPHLQRRHKRDFATCDVCDQFDFELAQPNLTHSQRQSIKADKQKHVDKANFEIKFMLSNMHHSSQQPSDRVMLFVDYTTALKFPHFFDVPEVGSSLFSHHSRDVMFFVVCRVCLARTSCLCMWRAV